MAESEEVVIVETVERTVTIIKRSSMTESEKDEWPELVGETGEDAREQVLKDRPGINVVVMHKNKAVSPFFDANRVFIFVDNDGNVVNYPHPPKVG